MDVWSTRITVLTRNGYGYTRLYRRSECNVTVFLEVFLRDSDTTYVHTADSVKTQDSSVMLHRKAVQAGGPQRARRKVV